MSDTIGFLEAVGRGELSVASEDGYVAAIEALDIAPALRCALAGRDSAELGRLLGTPASMMSQQWAPRRTPDNVPSEQPDPDRHDEDEDEPVESPDEGMTKR